MISVTEAEKLIMGRPIVPVHVSVPFSESLGMVLAEPVYADRDFPPYTRVAMDGFAIAFEDLGSGNRTFKIEGVQAAGEPGKKLRAKHGALEVMTGAVLPEGTDTVIRYEDCTVENGSVTINEAKVRQGQNAHLKGMDRKKGDVIIKAGTLITSADIPVLATVGKLNVKVTTLPEVAIVSSGDELIPITDIPEPHQIRRSNSYNIKALLDRIKVSSAIYHIPDKKDIIEQRLQDVFKRHHIVILSGGVSMGKFDFIPEALENLGVDKKFHKVEQRPGKPFWFGYNKETTVFALPGNPVSSFICSLRYFMPWVYLSIGRHITIEMAILDEDFSFKPELTYFLQVKIDNRSGQLFAIPSPGHGSGDLANLVDVNGFMELPAASSDFKKGESYRVWRFR